MLSSINHSFTPPAPRTGSSHNRTHEVPVNSTDFAVLEAGTRTFDLRLNDQQYQAGDALLMREVQPDSGHVTGQTLVRWVSYVLQGGTSGLHANWCVLGLSEFPPLPAGVLDTKLW